MIKAMETIAGNVKETGPRGLSAYEIYVQNGGNLTEEEWLESLKGEQGPQGPAGPSGVSDYNDLTNKPTIPTKTSELENDSNFLTEHQDISGKQDVLTAGENIIIDENNVISAIGGSSGLPTINVEDLEKSGTRYIIDDNIKPFTLITVNSYAELILVGTTSGYISLSQGLHMIWYKSNVKPSTSSFGSLIHIKLISMAEANNNLISSDYSFYKQGTSMIYTKRTFSRGEYATQEYAKTAPTTYTGYDATKTQVLKNINGVLTWVDEV